MIKYFIIIFIIFIILRFKNGLKIQCYNFWQGNNTAKYYKLLFNKIGAGSKIIDIGVGTGYNLVKNRNTILDKNLYIYGIDIDKQYNDYCKKLIKDNKMNMNINIEFIDFFDVKEYLEYDYAIFGQSFPVIPRNIMTDMLTHTKKLIKYEGKIIFLHQLDDEGNINHLFYKLKPQLKNIPFVWIDSGIATSKIEFERWLDSNNMRYNYKIIHTDKVLNLNLNIYMYICSKK